MWRSAATSRRILCLIIAALTLSGCSSWRLQEGPPRTAVDKADQSANPVRVTLNDGRRFEVYGSRIVGDSLVGTLMDPALPAGFGVATKEIASIETQRFDAAKTVVAVVLVSGLAAAIIVGIAFASWGEDTLFGH